MVVPALGGPSGSGGVPQGPQHTLPIPGAAGLPFPSLFCKFLLLKMLFLRLRESEGGRETLVHFPLIHPPELFLTGARPGVSPRPWCTESAPPHGATPPGLPEASRNDTGPHTVGNDSM